MNEVRFPLFSPSFKDQGSDGLPPAATNGPSMQCSVNFGEIRGGACFLRRKGSFLFRLVVLFLSQVKYEGGGDEGSRSCLLLLKSGLILHIFQTLSACTLFYSVRISASSCVA